VLVEFKSLESLARVHRKQVLTCLRLFQLKLGRLIHFGGYLFKGILSGWSTGWMNPLSEPLAGLCGLGANLFLFKAIALPIAITQMD